MSEILQQIKCHACGKVILEADIKDGKVRRKCKCGVYTTIEIRPADQAFTDRLNLSKK